PTATLGQTRVVPAPVRYADRPFVGAVAPPRLCLLRPPVHPDWRTIPTGHDRPIRHIPATCVTSPSTTGPGERDDPFRVHRRSRGIGRTSVVVPLPGCHSHDLPARCAR